MLNQNTKYKINKSFYERYFKWNAYARLSTEYLSFLFFKKGHFINLNDKNQYIEQSVKEEIENFYEKKEFNIPQIEFNITTHCTLKCKDCCAFIPKYERAGKLTNLSYNEFKSQLDKLCESANRIRHFIFIGGEPLINAELPEMIEYACKKENIDIIQITTNGTMLPSKKLLEALKKNNKKANMYMSNYSANKNMLNIFKYDEIKKLLKENHIKFQIIEDLKWWKVLDFSKQELEPKIQKQNFENCYRTKCTQILNENIGVCSKALAAKELNIINIKDFININETKNLREDLINFYQKDIIDACKYCLISEEEIPPAIQEE